MNHPSELHRSKQSGGNARKPYARGFGFLLERYCQVRVSRMGYTNMVSRVKKQVEAHIRMSLTEHSYQLEAKEALYLAYNNSTSVAWKLTALVTKQAPE